MALWPTVGAMFTITYRGERTPLTVTGTLVVVKPAITVACKNATITFPLTSLLTTSPSTGPATDVQ